MNQNKMYKYATWALLFLNIAVLAFFILIKPRPPHHPPAKEFKAEVVKILDLDEQQAVSFKTMANDHHQKLSSINEEQQKLLQQYFEDIADATLNVEEEQTLVQFQKLERKKMEVTRRHLEAVKSLLNEEQLPRFKDFVRKFTDRVLMTGKNNPPPHRK